MSLQNKIFASIFSIDELAKNKKFYIPYNR